jgi:hypothetical protein
MTSLPGTENRIGGTAGPDTIIGTAADDYIVARGGGDNVDGIGGDDYLDGGPGNDSLIGGPGDDWLIGGLGNDVLTGGAGADQFRFHGYHALGQEFDVVTDLDFAEGDLLVLPDWRTGSFPGVDAPGLEVNETGPMPNSRVTISSWQGMVELVKRGGAVSATRQGETNNLLVSIAKGDGAVQVISIENGWDDYSALLNQSPVAVADDALVDEDATISRVRARQ